MSSIRTHYGAYQCDLWFKGGVRFAILVVILGPMIKYFDYTHKIFIDADDIAVIKKHVPVPRNIKTVLMLEAL